MNRRTFLKTVAAVVSAGLAAKLPSAAPVKFGATITAMAPGDFSQHIGDKIANLMIQAYRVGPGPWKEVAVPVPVKDFRFVGHRGI